MNREAIIKILNTIQVYISNEFDGVYQNVDVLDELVNDLKEAIHCDECCNRDELEYEKEN